MAEDIKTKIKNYGTASFDSCFPNQNQTRNCWQNDLDFHRCEKAMTQKGVMSLCVNGIGVYTSPGAPYPGFRPGMTARQKARFLGRSELGILHPSPREVKGGLSTPQPRILNHGLTNNKYLLEICKKKKKKSDVF
ncbi:unnamed protein product [Pipistrellus nathusii]|uniref:Uncharacterized protein n=1 Tax=Pipistrellus nathusii TaxID=59473 RepID=A0ABN9Z102_PIPNA